MNLVQIPAFYARIAALTYALCLTVMLLFVLMMPLLGGEAMRLAREGVSRNADWQPVVGLSPGGVEMMLVPTGCFMMGDDSPSGQGPAHEQCFPEPFWIDRYEVTNKQFERVGGMAEQESIWTDPNRPRETITWFEVRAFCELRGARLPTEAEWEYAARGPDSLVYPWGNEFDGDKVVWLENSSGTADVGSKPGGVSWTGAYDMSGNVWEWTHTIYGDYPYEAEDGREADDDAASRRVIHGGEFSYHSPSDLRPAVRYDMPPDIRGRGSSIGFRCASR